MLVDHGVDALVVDVAHGHARTPLRQPDRPGHEPAQVARHRLDRRPRGVRQRHPRGADARPEPRPRPRNPPRAPSAHHLPGGAHPPARHRVADLPPPPLAASTNPQLLVSQKTAPDPDHPPASIEPLRGALPKGLTLHWMACARTGSSRMCSKPCNLSSRPPPGRAWLAQPEVGPGQRSNDRPRIPNGQPPLFPRLHSLLCLRHPCAGQRCCASSGRSARAQRRGAGCRPPES
ncbi:hypothetical protein [Streptomyces sp. V1I6]|uniref:hypothetical protein n=1 Tax=Streptomyces sp. V1I6 TaxID=3042273 RepID=UPI003593C0CC